MKTKLFAILTGVVAVATGCVSTVSGTHTAAVTPSRDYVADTYDRPLEQVYNAAVTALQTEGTLVTEYIPHDETNSVKALYGLVNDHKVWIRVEAVEQRASEVTVQSRTKLGVSDIDTAHEVAKEIALQLQQSSR